MGKIGLIIKREYLSRVKKKSFVIMTFLGPILMAGIFIGAIFLGLSESDDHKVLVVDKTPGSLFKAKLHNMEGVKFYYTARDFTNKQFKESPYTLMLYLNETTIENNAGELFYQEKPGFSTQSKIQHEVENVMEDYKLNLHKISKQEYKSISTEFNLVTKDINKSTDDANQKILGFVGFGFAIVIYFFIFIYGIQVMRGVTEEKTNRIVEVLISSVKPFELMMGKIIGIALVGLTQFLLWVILTIVLSFGGQGLLLKDRYSPEKIANEQTSPEVRKEMQAKMTKSFFESPEYLAVKENLPLMLGMFVFYFLGGFLVYASLFAAVGAAVDSETDSQQFMMPITIPLVFGFIVAEMSLVNPGGTAVTWFSMIPLTSPVVMMVRTAQGFNAGNIWQLFTSMALLIAFFLFCVWFAAKIYRTGILMYGKKVSYKELWKWLRYNG